MHGYKGPLKKWQMQCLIFFLSSIIMSEYGWIVFSSPIFSTFEGQNLSSSYQQFLVLKHQRVWALPIDFLALMEAYVLIAHDSVLKHLENRYQQRVSGNRKVDTERLTEEYVSPPRVYTDEDIFQSSKCLQYFKSLQFDPSRDNRVHINSIMDIENARVSPAFMSRAKNRLFDYFTLCLISCWLPFALVVIFIVNIGVGGLISCMYGVATVYMLYFIDDVRLASNDMVENFRKLCWLHLLIVILVSSPFLETHFTLESDNCVYGSNVHGTCVCPANILGIVSDSIPYGPLLAFILLSIQCQFMQTSQYAELDKYLRHEKDEEATRRCAILLKTQEDERVREWIEMKYEKQLCLQRLKFVVTKLVEKTQDLLDVAMGLNHTLPPMAPAAPKILSDLTTHNSVTVSWEPPANNIHKVRAYRISYQHFPSMTLLGDYNVALEVKGGITEAKIEGLRPGSTYQFKVAAISRMGEGPSSAPSIPIATTPLMLDNDCTAGWIKYRLEHVPNAPFNRILQYFNPTYLNRYVVFDKRMLALYKNEEAALRNHSQQAIHDRIAKGRRRRRTSLIKQPKQHRFLWNQVLSLELSNTKMRLDDVSPSLYCFVLLVHTSCSSARGPAAYGATENDHQSEQDVSIITRYTLQAESARDFRRFLIALANLVPLNAIGNSIIRTLRKVGLPDPVISRALARDNEDADERVEYSSEIRGSLAKDPRFSAFEDISSEYGNDFESSYEDSDDTPFEENLRIWLSSLRSPFYNWLHQQQDASDRAETPIYEIDAPAVPTAAELIQVMINNIRSRTEMICYIAIVASFTSQVRRYFQP